jgi:serine/threonine-protein kinase
VIVAILSDPDTDSIPAPTPTQSESVVSESPAVEETPTESPAPKNVLILRSDIIGENLSAVTARLSELGMRVNAIPGELIPGTDPRVRTVYAVSPTGNIEVGSVVDITYYVGDVDNLPVEIPNPGGETDSSVVTDSGSVQGESGSGG